MRALIELLSGVWLCVSGVDDVSVLATSIFIPFPFPLPIQETMVNFVALLVSLVLTPAVVDKQKCVCVCVCVHTCAREQMGHMSFLSTHVYIIMAIPTPHLPLPSLTPSLSPRVVWALFLLFTFLHLFANWRAVRAVIMSRVNRNRFHLLVDMYLKEGGVRSPEYINGKETLLPSECVEGE